MVKQFSPIDQFFPIIEIFSTHVHTYKSNPLFLLSWNIFSLRVNDIFVVNFQAFDHKDLTGYISRMNAHSTRHCNNTKLPRNLYFPSIHFCTSVSLNNNSRSAGEGRFSQWNESEKRRGKFENGKRPFLLSNMTELQLVAIIKPPRIGGSNLFLRSNKSGGEESSIARERIARILPFLLPRYRDILHHRCPSMEDNALTQWLFPYANYIQHFERIANIWFSNFLINLEITCRINNTIIS